MGYTNNLTPSEISDMLMSISNSMYQEIKRHHGCAHNEDLQEAYRMVSKVDSLVCWYILSRRKMCKLK